MIEMFEPFYKRTKKGGFVIWKVEDPLNNGDVIISYGNIENPTVTDKRFANRTSAIVSMTKTRNKKKAEGLYHTLTELGIAHVQGTLLYRYISICAEIIMGTLTQALDANLPPFGSTAKLPVQKPLDIEPIEIINWNIPINIHLPRL